MNEELLKQIESKFITNSKTIWINKNDLQLAP